MACNIQKTGVILIDEMTIEDDELAGINNEQQRLIIKGQRTEKLPEKAHLFDGYIHGQQAECDELENEISGIIAITGYQLILFLYIKIISFLKHHINWRSCKWKQELLS